MHLIAQEGVEGPIAGERFLVRLMDGGVRSQFPGNRRPVEMRGELGCARGEQRAAVAGTDRLRGDDLRASGDVGDDLRPEASLCASADGDDPSRRFTRGVEDVEYLSNAVRDSFVCRAQQVTAAVAERQADDYAAGLGVEDRGTLAGEVGQQHEPIRAGGHRGCLTDEPVVGRATGQVSY